MEADPTACLLRAEVKATLTAAVADLPKRQRQVISALFMAEDRDHQCYAAVAERFQVPTAVSARPANGRCWACATVTPWRSLSREPKPPVAPVQHVRDALCSSHPDGRRTRGCVRRRRVMKTMAQASPMTAMSALTRNASRYAPVRS